MSQNLVSNLDEKFQRMELLIESFMNTVYAWDSIDPLEVAIFLHVLSGKQLDSALEVHMGLTSDHIEAIAKTQIDRYNATKTIDHDTFIGETLGLQAIAGTRLMQFHSIINDFKHVDRDIITPADLDDGGPM